MKSLRNAFKTSPKLESEGIYLELANARLKIRRAGGANTRFNEAMSRVAEQHKRAIATGLITDEKAKQVLYEVYAEHVVVSWETNVGTESDPRWVEGIEPPEDGADLLPVTFENVLAFFKEMPDFFLEVKETAESVQGFREALIKHVSGN